MASDLEGLPGRFWIDLVVGLGLRVRHGLVPVLSGGHPAAEADAMAVVDLRLPDTDQLVLQGFARDEFDGMVRRYFTSLGLTAAAPDRLHEHIWQLSNGNIYLMRHLVWGLVEGRTRVQIPSSRPVHLAEVSVYERILTCPATQGKLVFAPFTEHVAQEAECLPHLVDLLSGRLIEVQPDGPPGELELAGIAVRAGASLRFSSPLVERFSQRYYDGRRLGELFAIHGDWEHAFACYRLPSAGGPSRAALLDEPRETQELIRALGNAMYAAAIRPDQGAQEVERLFRLGASDLLGFTEAAIWFKRRGSKGLTPPMRAHAEELCRLLPDAPDASAHAGGPIRLPGSDGERVLAVRLPAPRGDGPAAALLGAGTDPAPLLAVRRRLGLELLRHFAEAYGHACEDEWYRGRSAARLGYNEVVTGICRELGGGVQNVRQALDYARGELVKLGYRRVFFSLVDQERRRIKERARSKFPISLDYGIKP